MNEHHIVTIVFRDHCFGAKNGASFFYIWDNNDWEFLGYSWRYKDCVCHSNLSSDGMELVDFFLVCGKSSTFCCYYVIF